MERLNLDFFEQYKRLNKLCGEIYQEQQGVTRYIEDMKEQDWPGCHIVPGWKEDLEQLRRLRHIRNHLAHTEDAFSEAVCTRNDIQWLRAFHERILSQTDPLAKLYQHRDAMAKKQAPMASHGNGQTSCKGNKSNRHMAGTWAAMIAIGLWLIVTIFLYFH